MGLWQWEGETLRLVESQASLRKMLFDGLEFGIEAWATALSASGDFFAASGEGAVLSFFSAKCGDFGMGLFSIALGAPADTFVLSLAFVRTHAALNHRTQTTRCWQSGQTKATSMS